MKIFHIKNLIPRNLFLLFVVFVIGFGSQALLNVSIENFISQLDQRMKNSQVENLISDEIILDIHKMESSFYRMSAFPNAHLRTIIANDILDNQQSIEHGLHVLNQGGVYKHRIDFNLANTEKRFEILIYQPDKLNTFSLANADILPKFTLINQKLADLARLSQELDVMIAQNDPKLTQQMQKIKLDIKLFTPFFHRIKEDAYRILKQNHLKYQQVAQEVETKKTHYRNLQISVSLFALIFGLIGFWLLSRNINNSIRQIKINQDYSQDILEAQRNIIIVTDGQEILDTSGGFFQFFSGYQSLSQFTRDYPNISDLFVHEPGYVYHFESQNWIDYLIEHPQLTHKVKIEYRGNTSIFQINAVKSEKYARYIISMFDISENERINLDLQDEKNRALAATQAKGEFLANMSHEIRTPLNAILGFISLLNDKVQDEEGKNYVATINNSSHSLLGIINDILDLSKIESGKLSVDPVEFNPRIELNSTADLFKARCSEKNINFHTVFSDNLPARIETDVLRVKQVINNLLSNAVKFTEPNKSISLEVEYLHGFLHCVVTDEGIGMTPEFKERIFEAFTQAETSTTRKYGGTGLGLTISAKLIEMLGGELKCESTLNVGSQFSFKIPVQAFHEDIKPKETIITLATQFKGHVLLVEDNKTNQLLMSAILTKQGLTFDIANDGLEALEAVHLKHYDLVLMDENMPNLSGIEATQKIRELEQQQALPGTSPLVIVAVTANAMMGDRERFIGAGMNEYISKPIHLPKLLQIFAEFLPVREN